MKFINLEYKLPIPVDHLTVNLDFGTLAHIAYHVPMNDALVLAAGFRIASAQGHME